MPEFVNLQVLRDDAAYEDAQQPMRLQPIGAEGEPNFGCPMLTRTRLELPFAGNHRLPHCAVGWAVHDEDEVLLCMNTPTRGQCWKEHPEYLDSLLERLRPVIERELADQDEQAG